MHPDENPADIVAALARVILDTYPHHTAELMTFCIFEYTMHQSHLFPWTRLQYLAELVEAERRALMVVLKTQLIEHVASLGDHPKELEKLHSMSKLHLIDLVASKMHNRMKSHLILQVVSRMHLDDIEEMRLAQQVDQVEQVAQVEQQIAHPIIPSPFLPSQLQCEQHQCPSEYVMQMEMAMNQVCYEASSAQ